MIGWVSEMSCKFTQIILPLSGCYYILTTIHVRCINFAGNNEDADYESKAGEVAKQTYTIGIPHYELGSTSTGEANAAKYQAFTIGTVRFIITDLGPNQYVPLSIILVGSIAKSRRNGFTMNSPKQKITTLLSG